MTCQCLKRRVTRGSVPSRATLWLRPVSTRRKAASKANGPGKGVPAKCIIMEVEMGCISNISFLSFWW